MKELLRKFGDPLAHEVSTVFENFSHTRAEFFAHHRGALIERECLGTVGHMTGTKLLR